jgi:hypothetical protein
MKRTMEEVLAPDLAASLPKEEEVPCEVCSSYGEKWLPERRKSHREACLSIEQPWKMRRLESRHEV